MGLKHKRFDVLDHGYVKLIDYMGSDEDIVKAARVSYDAASTTQKRKDADLIDFLMRHHHTSPFEMATLIFEVKLPIFVERQWVRHRTCSMNEMSARYSELPEEYYVPVESAVGEQSNTNKQVRNINDKHHPHGEIFRRHAQDNGELCFRDYKHDLEKGIARELARIQLPLGTYTKKIWQMNLHNLLHFLKLRTDAHAQWEIQQYSNIIEGIVAELFPMVHKSWKNHVKDAVTFSRDEIEILSLLMDPNIDADKPIDLENDNNL